MLRLRKEVVMGNEDLRPLNGSEFNEYFPDMEKYHDMVQIYLNICDIAFDPDSITAKTNLKPYHVYKKGQIYKIRSGKEWVSNNNSWCIKYEHNNLPYPDKAINEFIEKIIIPHYQYFKEVLNNANGTLEFVYYYHYSNNIGIGFEKDFVKILSDLNLRVDFDLYCLHKEM
jgi:hypothetical protein